MTVESCSMTVTYCSTTEGYCSITVTYCSMTVTYCSMTVYFNKALLAENNTTDPGFYDNLWFHRFVR